MAANPWQLGADVTALEAAARTWSEMSSAMVAAADQLVATAQKAFTSGWESMSAEGYDAHRKQVVGSLDTLALVAETISDTLTKVSGSLTAAQRSLDREWSFVALVPHTLVGADQMVVFSPASDEQNVQVETAKKNAAGIRSDLDHALYGDDETLRRARTEFDVTTRQWGDVVTRGPEAIDVLGWMGTGSGAVAVAVPSTTVAGETQSGPATAAAAGAAPPTASFAPVSVDFHAPSAAGGALAGASLLAAGRAARRGATAPAAAGTGALGGAPMAGGGGGGRGGGMLAGKGGGSRAGMRGPRVTGTGVSARGGGRASGASEPDEVRDAKQRALAERKAAREARKAAREAKAVEREAERAAAAKPVVNIVDD